MRSLLNPLSHLGAQLPIVMIGVILLAAVVILLITFLTGYALKKAEKKKNSPVLKTKAPKEEVIPSYQMPWRGGLLSQFLTLKGVFRVGDVSLAFLRALAFLRERLDNLTYKYQLPWYLMVGASNSGKSSLLESSGMALPVGMPDFGLKDNHPAMRWWFFNRGVVLDIHGSLVMEDHKPAAEERGWRTVLSLLGRYRAKRPLDGIILTIPVSELYGRERLSPENLNARARFLAQKLMTAQHYLGIRLPVYVIITKCDYLPGFQNFCHELPLAQHQNMLGWSVPYALHTAYAPYWVDEAFQTISENMASIRLEMFTQGVAEENSDGIFVLADEFSSLQGSLQLYLDHIFKNSAYEESLMLRGLYFCGDSGIQGVPAGVTVTENLATANDDMKLKADLSLSTYPASYPRPLEPVSARTLVENINRTAGSQNQATLLSWEESQYPSAANRPIFFGKDIFENKIFFESGLAYPIYSRLISANRNINLAKAGMIAFVGIGTFGMLSAYENFKKNYDFLMPVLGKVNSVLAQVSPSSAGEVPMPQSLFDAQAKSLLEMMNHLQRTSFFSFFIPSSWFSPIHHQLNHSLKISYEQIVLRTIYMDLLIKIREVLNFRPGNGFTGNMPFEPPARTTAFNELLNPTQTTEFNQFRGYVERVSLLAQNIDRYNQLRDSADPALLNDLVSFTFNMQLPAEFSASYQKFRKVLHESPYPPIDLKPYYPLAQSTLRGLYATFLNILFNPNDPSSLIGQLRYLTVSFGNGQNAQPIDLDVIRSFVAGIEQILPAFGTAGQTWIDGAYFNPGPAFSETIGRINDTPVFGPPVVEQLAQQTNGAFTAFHQELKQLNQLLITSTSADPAKPLPFSAGIFNIERSLNRLFLEPFMAKTSGEMFVTLIPENKTNLWNPLFIDEAVNLVKAYETFVEKELTSFPAGLRESLKQIALQNLQLNVTRNIAKAQALTDLPVASQIGDANEETLRTLVTNMKETLPSFTKLLETLNKLQNSTISGSLQNLLGDLSTRLLERVDSLLIAYVPYGVRDNNFDWWDGKSPVFLEGFTVHDAGELQSYLDHQRQLISHLGIDYAQPLVKFLNSDIMKGFLSNKALSNRWSQIIEQLGQYDKKRPNNTIITLENFIGKDSLNLTMDNCFQKISLAEVKQNSGDFFLDRRIQLRRALLARCEVAKRQSTIQNYEKLVSLYNTSLRDKFPFVNPNAAQTQGEADPGDLKQFFQLYNDFGGSPKNILEQVYQLGDDAKDPYLFLKQMETVKAFFQPYLDSQSPSDVPSFDFSVDFRVNQENETGGNMIIDWILAPNDVTKISNNDKKREGRWSYGSPVTMTFRWPDSSETQPFLDKTQPFMAVDGQTVTYTYPGQWAFFKMVFTQQATSSDFAAMRDTQPYTLRYEIPNGPEEKTIVYTRVTLRGPPKGKTAGAVLEIPSFPVSAPDLNSKIMDMANRPVIAQGLLDPNPQFLSEIDSQIKTVNSPAVTPAPAPAAAAPPAPADTAPAALAADTPPPEETPAQ